MIQARVMKSVNDCYEKRVFYSKTKTKTRVKEGFVQKKNQKKHILETITFIYNFVSFWFFPIHVKKSFLFHKLRETSSYLLFILYLFILFTTQLFLSYLIL